MKCAVCCVLCAVCCVARVQVLCTTRQVVCEVAAAARGNTAAGAGVLYRGGVVWGGIGWCWVV